MARAIAVFQSGIFIGTALAMLGGGMLLRWFERHPPGGVLEAIAPWRLVFAAVCLPGLVIGAALLLVDEPRRRLGSEGRASTPITAALRHVAAHARLYGGHFLAFTAITILAYGSLSWTASVLVRVHHLPTADAGLLLGVALLTAGPLGVMCSGMLADRFAKRGVASGPMLTAAISVLLLAVATPAFALSPSLSEARPAAFLLAFAQSFPYGIASASLAVVTPARLRGQIVALYLMVSNLFGLTLGPLAVALLTDHWFREDAAVGQSLALLPWLTTPLAMAGLAICWEPYRRAWVEQR